MAEEPVLVCSVCGIELEDLKPEVLEEGEEPICEECADELDEDSEDDEDEADDDEDEDGFEDEDEDDDEDEDEEQEAAA